VGLIYDAPRGLGDLGAALVVAAIVLLLPVFALVIARRRGSSDRRSPALFSLLALVFLTLTVGQVLASNAPLRPGEAFGPGPGIKETRLDGTAAVDGDPAALTDTAPNLIVGASPGQTYRFYLSVRNVSALPLTITGLVVPSPSSGAAAHYGYAFTAAALLRPTAGTPVLDGELPTFQPMSLDPGAEAVLAIEAQVTPCGPGVTQPPSTPAPGTLVATALTVAYGQLGLSGSVAIWPPFDLTLEVRC